MISNNAVKLDHEGLSFCCFFCPEWFKDLKDYDEHMETHKEWLREQAPQLTMWRQ